MRTIAVAGQKSASAKTTTALLLGAILAREYDQRVLLVDVDPQATLSSVCDVDGEGASLGEVLVDIITARKALVKIAPRLQILPSDISLAIMELAIYHQTASGPSTHWISLTNRLVNRLKENLKAIEPDFDLALLDLPSSLGFLTLSGLIAAQEILIPSRLEYVNLRALSTLVKMINDLRNGLPTVLAHRNLSVVGILPTFYNPRLRHHNEIITVWKETGIPTLDVYIQDAPQHIQALLATKPISDYDARNPIIQSYRQAAEFVIKGATPEG